MPIIKSAKKAHRASLRKRVFNIRRIKEMRDKEKSFREAIASSDNKKAQEILPLAYKAIDKAAKRGVIKKNTASRKKSRLSKLLTKKK